MNIPGLSGAKVDMVSAEQMTDAEREKIYNRKMSVDAIPDLDVLTGHVLEILQYLEKPSTIKMMETNKNAVLMHLNNKYADTVPYGIISLMMETEHIDEHMERLTMLFDSLRKAKAGLVSLEDVGQQLSDDVKKRYNATEEDIINGLSNGDKKKAAELRGKFGKNMIKN
jgi:hypothetical protein